MSEGHRLDGGGSQRQQGWLGFLAFLGFLGFVSPAFFAFFVFVVFFGQFRNPEPNPR